MKRCTTSIQTYNLAKPYWNSSERNLRIYRFPSLNSEMLQQNVFIGVTVIPIRYLSMPTIFALVNSSRFMIQNYAQALELNNLKDHYMC